ncbi:MAG: DUF547 domain-containing protein [Bdellovibrionales bacterium]
MIRKILLCLILIPLGACASVERLAIPDSQLINPALANTGEQTDIDHTQWDNFLKTYTAKDDQGVVRVNYANVSDTDHSTLKSYITTLSTLETSNLSKDAQLSYWTNLYNATTVNVILENYPVNSIRDIKDGLLDLGPWDDKRLTLNGRPTSLHDIEHGIIRPLWNDTPEIHYILNCAAAGCPNLAQQAYTAQNVKQLMQQAAISFINDPLRGIIVQDDGRIIISKIYSWYQDDFGGSQSTITQHLKTYANPKLKNSLAQKKSFDGLTYDWRINDKKNANTLKKPTLLEQKLN